MGYRRKRTTYELTFEEYDGLEVVCRALSTRELMGITHASDEVARLGPMARAEGEEGRTAVEELFDLFVPALVSWNYEDEDGNPVPKTTEALLDEELPFVLSVIEAFTQAVAGVEPDLGKDSPSGETFPEVSIPMAPL